LEHPLAQLSDAVLTAHSLNSGLFYSLAEILKDLSFAHDSTRQAEKHGIRRHNRAHRNQTIEE
jgi:hypothetical protein